ncbi:uncharacterized protein [Rutidosis leptorrhynchoides]|uniref:uncharacterized protein n=1 Tax=Rutidosis leptorrhynchoides TaxID=125765 RepID=UPI003A9939D6
MKVPIIVGMELFRRRRKKLKGLATSRLMTPFQIFMTQVIPGKKSACLGFQKYVNDGTDADGDAESDRENVQEKVDRNIEDQCKVQSGINIGPEELGAQHLSQEDGQFIPVRIDNFKSRGEIEHDASHIGPNTTQDGIGRAKMFNYFIDRTQLIDIPLEGKLFTRVSDDRKKFMIDFGPKPIRVFDVWWESNEAVQTVSQIWNSNIDGEIHLLKKSVKEFELKTEKGQINEQERAQWMSARKDWIEKENQKTSWNINGARVKDPGELKKEASRYLECLFKDPYENSTRVPYLEDDLPFKKLTDLDATELEKPFEEVEIWAAIKRCGGSKALGPDEFNFKFFKRFWETIKIDLRTTLDRFWTYGEISRGCKASFITLIPKKPNVITLNDFRPISLLGSYYKIVSKILANRIRKVIPSLIGSEQSSFLEGRFILDGVLIANKAIFDLNKNKKKSFLFKFDFEKPFDSIRWDFLFDILKRMGFKDKW